MREKNHALETESMKRTPTTSLTRRWIGVLAVSLLAVTAGAAATASAQVGAGTCSGDIVVDGGGVTLRNVTGFRTAGPFDVDLEPGWYVVTALSQTVGVAGERQMQQWTIEDEDGSWESEKTLDVEAGTSSQRTVFEEQEITEAVSSIVFRHAGGEGLSAVTPVCVAFTEVDGPADALVDDDDENADDDDEDDNAVVARVDDDTAVEGRLTAELAKTDSRFAQRAVGVTLLLIGIGGVMLAVRERLQLGMVRPT